MKALVSVIVAVFLTTTAGSAVGLEQKDIDIKTADGITLRATYYWPVPDKLGPAILLLHQCPPAPGNRLAWNELATDLAGAGIHVLAVDFRGHGGSGGDRSTSQAARLATLKEKGPDDVDTMYSYLLSQKFINKNLIAIGGTGCSAGLAADAAARHQEIKALVMLSGAASEPARGYISQTPGLAVFAVMGEEDDSRQAAAIKQTIAASKNAQSTIKTFVGPGNGVLLFPLWPDLVPSIGTWIKAQLSSSTATK